MLYSFLIFRQFSPDEKTTDGFSMNFDEKATERIAKDIQEMYDISRDTSENS